jgi:hypothetical protein
VATIDAISALKCWREASGRGIFEWRTTNTVEQHCRVAGRIVGKLQVDDQGFNCLINAPHLHYVGFRRRQDVARACVEAAVVKHWEKKVRTFGKGLNAHA